MGNNEWLDIDVLDDYLEGKLDANMMHKVERISLEDPFVAQALAGLTEAKKRTQTLSLLQKQLHERIAEKPVERKMWRIASMRLSIAATAAVLFITVSVLFWMRENHRQQQAELAANKPKTIEIDLKPEVVAIAPADTVIKAKPETLVDKQKVEQALSQTLAKGSQIIAKNNHSKDIVAESLSLQRRETTKASLKKETNLSQATIISTPIAAPKPPVQILEGRVDDIQVQYSNAKVVKGVILDVNGRPIPGAEIKMVGNDLRAITNTSGEFTLPADKQGDKVALEVASLGFAKKNVEAKTNEKINVQLEENNSALSEVVVVGYGAQKKSANSDTNIEKAKQDSSAKSKVALSVSGVAGPKEGWPAYGVYLQENNRLFNKGDKLVELSFEVLENGSLVNIKVLKGQTSKINAEAVRLLKDGPKWDYNPRLSNKGSITIKF